MNLFFQTHLQAQLFLVSLPIGFLLTLCLDLLSRTSFLRILLDVVCIVVFAFLFLGYTLILRDSTLRIYHFLAILCGGILYWCGIGQLLRLLWRKVRYAFKKSNTNADL